MTITNMRQIDKRPEQVQTDWILVEKGVSKEVFVKKSHSVNNSFKNLPSYAHSNTSLDHSYVGSLEFPTKSILKMCVVD
ncbi:hypothetical protein CEXT_378901 [Caerostris extrusa]|uniref:Uncharacterized protein n=1 Tax=Caerostris extrusa TaxID=172846 RepID=A0AAV4QYB8_CAEEX|nr:hypothetical protein CEXT_378901 [Caerostris extrusa]